MRRLLLFSWLCCAVLLAQAQTRTITGKITNKQTGIPLPGASITIKGTAQGTTTRDDGSFSLTVPTETRTLVISSIGYGSTEVNLGNSNTLNVPLTETEAKNLDEVVITGYTKENRSRFVGAASTVSGKVIENVPMASFDQILQGRTPGMVVNSGSGQPGSSARVTIRGIQSIAAAGAQPLYILDGVPVEAGVFQSLNPNDFESIAVLKDASATALYGSRAATGVIVINSKKGKAGRTNFTYRGQMGFNDFLPPTNFDLMNSQEKLLHEENNKYGPGWTYSDLNPAYGALPATSPGTNPYAPSKARYDFLIDSLGNNNVDFFDLLFRKGRSQMHELGVSGGSDKTRFYVSGNYFNQQGTDLRSDLDRYTVRFNLDHTSNRFSIGITNIVGFTESNFSEGDLIGNSARNPFQIAWRAMPYENPYYPDGKLNFGTTTSLVPKYIGNTIEGIENTIGRNMQLKINTGLNLSYEIIPHLTLRTTVGVDMRNDRWLRYINPASQVGNAQQYNRGLNSEANDTYTTLISTTGATYVNRFNDRHDVEGGVWFEAIRNWQRALGFTVFGLDPRLTETGQGAGNASNGFPPTATSAKSGYGIRSLFGLLKYTLDNKYTISVSARQDGTSRIVNPDNRNFFSWSAGAIWNVNQESFMDRQSVFSNLKMRLSYGITPNINSITNANYAILGIPAVNVPNYQGPQSPSFGTATYPGSTITGIVPTSPGNPDLKIENVQKWNFGFDMGFWNNRAQLIVDLYYNRTRDLFVNQPLPRESGFANQAINAGIMSNKGIEIAANVDVIKTSDVVWNLGFNHAINKNNIEDLGKVEQYETGTFLIKKGLPYGSHYTYQYLGADPATGRPVYETQDGGLTTDLGKAGRFTRFGNFMPGQVGGITTDLRVKSITLSVLFSYQFDVMRSNNILSWVTRNVTSYSGVVNQLSEVNQKSWLKPGDVMPYQAATFDRDFTSTDIQDASFIRLRTITLSYNLPTSVSSKMKVLRGARFYVSGQNLLIWSPWVGTDPEDNNNISLNEYPSSRMIVAGIDINF